MKKTTSSKLTKQLSAYGAMTVALAGITDANGQIVYTDIPDVSRGTGGSLLIDMNPADTDGSEFEIENTGFPGTSERVRINILKAGDGFAAVGADYPTAFSGASVISSGLSWRDTQPFDLSYSVGIGNFGGAGDKYLGVRFNIGGSFHYGWIRANVVSLSDWTIKDFAYNATPGASINAGQTTLGVDTNLATNVRIASLNKTISLHNLPGSTSYQLYSMTGQSLLEGSIEGSTYAIEGSNLASGIYILQLTDLDTNATLRKKVAL
ncbi:T9SS type A sorting domain-containing protein [Leptobacterium sp. I13]|uniref:T9SS type A sorting domain-containing protein n=1 Tax=Leptobacterium meishanense TaxID=3128904 RepID=UPI0030EC6C74